MSNPLVDLGQQGQSVWYDNIGRSMITTGELNRLIDQDGLSGMTSNPAIFEKAISGSDDYRGVLRQLSIAGLQPLQIYESIAIEDICWAADVMLPVYERTEGVDGYVSLEVSPHLADDTQGTVEEALRLANEVGRQNVMIKVPGTPAGVPAVEQLIAQGISINVTLLFSQENYLDVARAYVAGLEQLRDSGGDVSRVGSVASFFVSRIDAAIDGQIDQMLPNIDSAERRVAMRALKGRVAIANAKLAYASFKQLLSEESWRSLAAAGARPQRLLWASTSVKNPTYRDVLYVEELIGPQTVNTMPEATYLAFRDHGIAKAALEEHVDEATDVMAALAASGISISEVTNRLQADAVRLFVEPFDKLLAAINDQRSAIAERS
ncbi:MAG: transaldolase [Gemmatimonadetes bacterium]|jgi:transaldolase|nr:transaldolase [Gemmatimonadota bacterium]MBT4612550.1 transaldolase [Gemmatimonadota bacterium]MBT5056560.1 transaldolase [Gemmatimonadota bacterium]MBT5145258.1 transaldolase [Gemmatimonadota bacterium]MBT5589639.1 transaldolase [Gemmatimonadota bacterium]